MRLFHLLRLSPWKPETRSGSQKLLVLATVISFIIVVFASLAGQGAVLRVSAEGPFPEQKHNNGLFIACQNGFAGAYPCQNVNLLAHLPLTAIGGGGGNDLWGWTDPQTGKEYALMGRTSGTAFVDISQPESPRYLGNLPSHSFSSLWRDIKVYQNYALIIADAAGSHGLQIFDLTQLRTLTGTTPLTFAETAHYNQFGSAHNLAVNEASGFVYVLGISSGSITCNSGLHMLDFTTPTNPQFAGCFGQDGYTHDAQCVIYEGPDTIYQGRELCFNANEDTLTIVDVSEKMTPTLIARVGYPGAAYTHQGWLSEDQRYFLLGDEQDELQNGHNTRTYIWDLSNLDVPLLIGAYTHETQAIDHNLYVKGNRLYEANYQAGLRILDLGRLDEGLLTEIAYFDSYPQGDQPAFNGAWSVYPFFQSGVLALSTIEDGLFILEQHPPEVNTGPLQVHKQVEIGYAPSATYQVLTYTIRFSQTGTAALAGVRLTDTLPSPLVFGGWVGEVGSAQLVRGSDGESIRWGPHELQPADETLLRFTASASGVLSGHNLISNQVESRAENGLTATAYAAFRVNFKPVARNDSYTITHKTTQEMLRHGISIPAPGLLANDWDQDHDSIYAILVSPPERGQLLLKPEGAFIYTPTVSYTLNQSGTGILKGFDSFTYRLNDGIISSTPATVTLNLIVSPQHQIFLPLVLR